MKTIAAISALILSVSAWSDGQAPITFSGKGKSGIEVRDASGKVTEIRGSSNLHLNQIPADAVAREETYRAKRKEIAGEASARRAEQAEEIAEEQKLAEEAAAAETKAQTEAAATAEAEAKFKEAQHPEKVRRKTVRGTLFIENPVIKPDTPAAPQGPVLSMTGPQKKAPGPAAENSTKPADAAETP